MQDCMRYAVENSYAVMRASNRLLAARQDYTAAIGDHLPSLSASVGAGGNFGRGIDPATNTYVNTATFNNGYSASASMPVFRAFALLNSTLNAKVIKARSVSELEKAKDDVALRVMTLYIEVLYNQGLVELTEHRVESFEIDLHRAERMSELGTKSMADVAQFAATLAAEELALVTRSNQYDQSMLSLKQEMNFSLDSTLRVVRQPLGVSHDEDLRSAADIFRAATTYLPAIDVLRKTLRSSEYSLKIARSAYYPSISASGGVSTNFFTNLNGGASVASPFGSQFRDNMGEYVSVNLSIPIFNGLWTRTSVQKAKIAHKQAQKDFDENMRELRAEIERAVMDLETAAAQIEGGEKSVRASELALRAAERKYAEGMIDVIELNAASNQLMNARVELLAARLRHQAKSRQVAYYQGEALIN